MTIAYVCMKISEYPPTPPPPPPPPGVDQSLVSKSIKKLNPKKATGVDQLAAELIKAGSTALAGPISTVSTSVLIKTSFQMT